jgi:hypothetical protein
MSFETFFLHEKKIILDMVTGIRVREKIIKSMRIRNPAGNC